MLMDLGDSAMSKPWFVMFSRSGKTLADVCEHVGYWPDCVYTNNFGQFDSRILQQPGLYRLSHDSIMKIFRNQYFRPNVVTLMGYLNIIPPDICNYYPIYNLHPANIKDYPEYKGKDPIERIFKDNRLEALGNTLHKVTPEVDAGEIIQMETYTADTIEDAYNKANEYAVRMWANLLRTELEE